MTDASSMRSVPAAAFRGFAYGWSSCDRCRSFRRSNAPFGITTSPRTSNSGGRPALSSVADGIASGNERSVRALGVITSPCTPSPRVNAMTIRPAA